MLFNIFPTHTRKLLIFVCISIRNASRMTTVSMRDHEVVLEFGSYVLNYSLISNDVLSVEDNLDLNSHLWYLPFHTNDISSFRQM